LHISHLVWDIAHGHLVGDFSRHTGLITSLSFSRDGGVLASSSNDLSINLWDFSKFASELNLEEVNVTHNPTVEPNAAAKYKLMTFRTKESPIIGTHFTRRNMLLAFGPFVG
jgi:transcription initiation factor TFIID subunit 5